MLQDYQGDIRHLTIMNDSQKEIMGILSLDFQMLTLGFVQDT